MKISNISEFSDEDKKYIKICGQFIIFSLVINIFGIIGKSLSRVSLF